VGELTQLAAHRVKALRWPPQGIVLKLVAKVSKHTITGIGIRSLYRPTASFIDDSETQIIMPDNCFRP